jgi:hypothetical protein
MQSPFPGMDPYLEINPRWEGFHDWFVRELARQTMPHANDLGCWIDVERTIYERLPSGEVLMVADETIGIEIRLSGNGANGVKGGVALAEPRVVHDVVLDPEDQVKQDHLVVRELGQFNRILAVVEMLSPANKGGTYAARYREKRRRFMESSAHFMEIDFLRAGENPARDLFPELADIPYLIFFARKTAMGRKEEAYPLRLQDPLPVIGLPIGPPRPDLPLDLASAFRAAFDLSVRPSSIDHKKEAVPPPALADADAAWVRQIVGQ